VVLGETRSHSLEAITRAIRLIMDGARFSATNPDPTGPSPAGPQPATGAVAALVTKATGIDMDTDIMAGLETVLVLMGISSRADAERFAYRPTRIAASVAELETDLGLGGLA
jgi:NagD protein